MSNLVSKLEFVEKHLAQYYELKPKIDEERAIRNQKEQNNEYIDIKDDFVYYDKACSVVNEMLDSLIEVRNFLESNKDKLVDAAKKHNEKFFSLDEDLSELSEEEQKHYKELIEVHKVEDKLQRILESEELSKVFFEEILPKNLEQDFGITREEYDKVIEESDKNFNKEEFLQELFEKFLNEPQQHVQEETPDLCSTSFSAQLETSDTGQKSDPS